MSTEAEIIAWAALVEQKVKAHYVTSPHANPSISVQWGKRYARIIDTVWGGESAYCFVEIATGDCYKASSWKAPAKHVRGNISDTTLSFCTPYGLVHLRG